MKEALVDDHMHWMTFFKVLLNCNVFKSVTSYRALLYNK